MLTYTEGVWKKPCTPISTKQLTPQGANLLLTYSRVHLVFQTFQYENKSVKLRILICYSLYICVLKRFWFDNFLNVSVYFLSFFDNAKLLNNG